MVIFGERLLVQKPDEVEKTKGGLFIPDSAAGTEPGPIQVKVVKVPVACRDAKEGDYLLVNTFAVANQRACLNKEARLYLIDFKDVLAKIENGDESKYFGGSNAK